MDIDYNNADSVKKIIQQTNLSKFIIHKAGYNRNQSPVYEFTNSSAKNKDCIEAFDKWASITHNSNAYEISLFDDFDTTHYQRGEDEKNAKVKKSKLVKFTFCLMNIPQQQEQHQVNGNNFQQNHQPQESIAEAIAKGIEAYEKKREQDTTQQQLKAMSEKIDAFMNGEEEEEEEEEETNSEEVSAKQLFLINKVENILERLNIIPPAKAQLSGADTETKTENKSMDEEAIKSINNSILRLAKKDKQIVKHLKLLADLSENKPEMYQTAIDMLIKM